MASSKARGETEPEAYPQGYVEDSVEPRTKIGKRRVLARRGWAGGMLAFSPSCYRRRAITAKHTSKLLMVWARMPGSRLPVFSYNQAQRTPLHRTLMKPTNP